jgi:IS1 family transposase
MNELSFEKRCRIVQALIEGCGVRATARLVNCEHKTVLRILESVGRACKQFHDTRVVNLNTRVLQCDELWSFIYAKQKNLPLLLKGVPELGDLYCWIAIDADTKLVVGWYNGKRDIENAIKFIKEIKERLSHRVQLTTDGLKVYVDAIEKEFGSEIDFAQLIKYFGPQPTVKESERKYSPPKFIGHKKTVITGYPDMDKVSTSYIERVNLSIRMGNRRFTRLTNGFSKKYSNHCHALYIFFVYYNFVRIHQSLRVTPAMEAGLAKEPWEVGDMVKLIQNGYVKRPKKYRKR